MGKQRMMKLSKPQQRVLRTMVKLRCHISIYSGVQFTNRARAWFHQGGRWLKKPRVRLSTAEALERRGLVKAQGWPFGHDKRYRDLILTPKGREIAKELQDVQKAV